MKKLIATILIAAMLVMCCSCGLARDIAQLARERLQEAGTDGRLPQHGSLPALPSQPEPQIEAEDETSPLEEEFASLRIRKGSLREIMSLRLQTSNKTACTPIGKIRADM